MQKGFSNMNRAGHVGTLHTLLAFDAIKTKTKLILVIFLAEENTLAHIKLAQYKFIFLKRATSVNSIN